MRFGRTGDDAGTDGGFLTALTASHGKEYDDGIRSMARA